MVNIVRKTGKCSAIGICTQCREEYPIRDFYSARKSPVGDQCTTCKTLISSMEEITQENLLKAFNYDPDTGDLTYKYTTLSGKKGAIATYFHSRKYLSVCIGRKQYLAHRIIYMMMTGKMPEHVDHINHIKHDNRWENLRSVKQEENNRNMPLQRNTATNVTGVSPFKGKYRAYITVGGKHKHLGVFDSIEEAAVVRKQAESQYHYHSNHGK